MHSDAMQSRQKLIALIMMPAGFAVSIYLDSLLTKAHAITLNMTGGTCTFIDSAVNGYRLDFCKNMTNQTVDDIHLEITYRPVNADYPDRQLDYVQSLSCTLLGIGNCFGHAVAPGNNWEGSNGGTGNASNILIWNRPGDFNEDNVRLAGYWTKGGQKVEPVPAPLPLLGLGAVLGYSRKLRQRLKERSKFGA